MNNIIYSKILNQFVNIYFILKRISNSPKLIILKLWYVIFVIRY